MKRRIILAVVGVMLMLSTGCASILDAETLSVSPRVIAQAERNPTDDSTQIEVSNFYELKSAILGFVSQHTRLVQIVATGYISADDVQADVDRAIYEILNHDPLAAFAVADIIYEVTPITPIVSHFEIDLSIEYIRTRSEIDSIVTISTLRHLRNELLNYMSQYRNEMLIRTSLNDITTEYVMNLVNEIYYENPRIIVMNPITAAQAFPETHGDDKIIALTFRHADPRAEILLSMGETLLGSVRRNAELAIGDSDEEILLSLANKLIASTAFDEGTAQTISEHGTQTFAATAYGALIQHSAVGEGFAMAFKALSDELGFSSHIVLGYLDGMVHAWNIVSLYGEYYHIDVAIGALNGIETVFLKTDAEFLELGYTWDI